MKDFGKIFLKPKEETEIKMIDLSTFLQKHIDN